MMHKFNIQKINKLPIYDFGQAYIEAINLKNWLANKKEFTYKLSEEPIAKTIPIGSVEYVSKWFTLNNLPIPKPLNIPEELFDYCQLTKPKNISIAGDIFKNKESFFIKSNDVIKCSDNGIFYDIKPGNWQVSNVIEIKSEYRMFFYKSQILDIKKYIGDYNDQLEKHHISYIENIFKNWSNKPVAGTMDFLIDYDNNIQLIECHDWFSCGLYGFSSGIIINMTLAWFNRYKMLSLNNQN